MTTPDPALVERARKIAAKWCADHRIVPNGELALTLTERIADFAAEVAGETKHGPAQDPQNESDVPALRGGGESSGADSLVVPKTGNCKPNGTLCDAHGNGLRHCVRRLEAREARLRDAMVDCREFLSHSGNQRAVLSGKFASPSARYEWFRRVKKAVDAALAEPTG